MVNANNVGRRICGFQDVTRFPRHFGCSHQGGTASVVIVDAITADILRGVQAIHRRGAESG